MAPRAAVSEEPAARPAPPSTAVTDPVVPTDPAGVLREVSRLLQRTLRELASAGEGERACRIAADAWVLVREAAPVEATRFAGLLHTLARTEPPARGGREGDIDLDVREDPPARRHERIFETYSALRPGTGFVLINDHDPKPLYYQFAAEHAGEFEWDALEEGPEVWRVRIGRRPLATSLPMAAEPEGCGCGCGCG